MSNIHGETVTFSRVNFRGDRKVLDPSIPKLNMYTVQSEFRVSGNFHWSFLFCLELSYGQFKQKNPVFSQIHEISQKSVNLSGK